MRGFTLLETLVAMAILGLAITSVLQLMGASSRTAARTQAMTEAVFAAEQLMEEMATLDETRLRAASGETGDFAQREQRRAGGSRQRRASADLWGRGRRYSYALRVTPEPVEPGLYRVDVEVEWPNPSRGRVALTTLRRFGEEEVFAAGLEGPDGERFPGDRFPPERSRGERFRSESSPDDNFGGEEFPDVGARPRRDLRP